MRQIYKSEEPESLTNWKLLQRSTPSFHYRYLQNPIKRELHQFLLQEQGYICCYCEMRVSQPDSHIDHLKPQSECSDEETLEYTNLLACCQGEGEYSRKPEHCGQKRGNQLLKITPLNPGCPEAFRFTEDGQILANSSSALHKDAQSTIEILGLDIPKLQRMRREAIRRTLQDIESLSQEEIQKLVHAFDKPDTQGQYEAFCSAVLHQLQQLAI